MPTFIVPARRRLGRRAIAPAAVLALTAGLLAGPPAGAATLTADPTHTISQVQGTGTTTPLDGQSVTVAGVVTASYPTGGFAGFYLQEPGSGGESEQARTASAAVFVYAPELAADAFPAIGDAVQVTGTAGEFRELTQIRLADGGLSALPDEADAVEPTPIAFPLDAAGREAHEGMLVAPTGDWTVTDNHALGQYGEIGLAAGRRPLRQPTDVAAPGSADAAQVAAANADRAVTLDDGSSVDHTGAGKDTAMPWLSLATPVTVGARTTFSKPVILDHRFSAWRFQPTTALTSANARAVQPASFAGARTPEPDPVGGDLTFASFNVLNYFTTTGADYVAAGGACTFYTDRTGEPVTVRSCEGDTPGPRGAADAADRQRQEDKLVAAITALDADVVGVQEIENTAAVLGTDDRDGAVAALVEALNARAGADTWAYAASPAAVPADEDVIRNAFLYRADRVETVGASRILLDSPAFANAREPLAQVFRPKGGSDAEQFVLIVNHFKSKSAGDDATGDNADTGDGQGAFNGDRERQAAALADFAAAVSTATQTPAVFLLGDFNSYTFEDPLALLADRGYVNVGADQDAGQTYVYGGRTGSLDHVLANPAAARLVTGADVWNINAVEPVALEYSRYNANAAPLHAPDVHRASDHDPILVGLDLPDATETITLVNLNDFHGRIDDNTTRLATRIEKLRRAGGDDRTLLLSAGDNIGASLFASGVAEDKPTLDVLNALELAASAVGNHEFDQGVDDLTGRVSDIADFPYLGANVYAEGTTEPVLDEYSLHEVGDLTVGVIGVVTQETPTLVTPSSVAGIEFGDPVEAVNRVAAQLTDGDPANGEADVLVAEYHEGAGAGTPDGSTLAEEVAGGGVFAEIVEDTSAEVDVLFTAHTHKVYAWDAPVPGAPGRTRPVVQTGSYGERLGLVRLRVTEDGEVVSYRARNVARGTEVDTTLPRVAAVATIVEDALAAADEIGREPVGEIAASFTRARTGDNDDDRASESTLGNLVADSLVASLGDPSRGGAEIGVVNPGGLRADLEYAGSGDGSGDGNGDGVVTYAEANAVLPFVNNLTTLTLTGAQFTTLLEQQWQRTAEGEVPSRPFLHLGLSKNVAVTLDPSRPEGRRVTSVRIDGEPLDPRADYRIGTFSFLAAGGDNFHVLADGTDVRDSGLIDRDAWIDYLRTSQDGAPLTPDFARRQVYATGLPAAITPGKRHTFTLDRLDLTSAGAPAVSTVVAEQVLGTGAGERTKQLATFPVTDGSARITFTAPASLPAAAVVRFRARETGTSLTLPVVRRPAKVQARMAAAIRPARPVVGRTLPRMAVKVRAGGRRVTGGTIRVWSGKRLLGTKRLVRGKGPVRLKRFLPGPTRRVLRVVYTGTPQVRGTTVRVVVRVRR